MTSTLGIKKIQYPNGTNSITIDSSGSAAITTANITTANITNATATGTINTPSINGSQIGGRRNVIINGGMQVAQRGTSSTGLGAANGYFTVDRIRHVFSGTAGRLTSTQSTDAPSGFGNSLKFECTTADTSIASGEYLMLQYKIEGQDLQQFAKGTSDAKEFHISFYVKGNAAATYVLELYDNDNNRQCSKSFSVTSSWSRVLLTFPADTTGAFDNDNAVSLSLTFWLHAGTDFTSGTLNSSAFAANSNSSRALSTTSFFDSTARTFFITGLQLEVGSHTVFEHRSFGEELDLCHRYYEKTASWGYILGGRYNQDTGVPTATWFYKKVMRTSPSVSNTGTWTTGGGWGGAPLPIAITNSHVAVYSSTHVSASNNIWFNGGQLILDAEL